MRYGKCRSETGFIRIRLFGVVSIIVPCLLVRMYSEDLMIHLIIHESVSFVARITKDCYPRLPKAELDMARRYPTEKAQTLEVSSLWWCAEETSKDLERTTRNDSIEQ